MKADEPRQNRIPFMMSDAELHALDDWRFANKIGTRAEAIRRLCQIAIATEPLALALTPLFREIRQAESDAVGAILDIETNAETVPIDEGIKSVSQAHYKLSLASLELGVQVAALEHIFTALRSGEAIEADLDALRTKLREAEKERSFIRTELKG